MDRELVEKASLAVAHVVANRRSIGFTPVQEIAESILRVAVERCAEIANQPIRVPDQPGKLNRHVWPADETMTAVREAIRALLA